MEDTGIKVIGNAWIAIKDGKELARMFYDESSSRYEIWSIYENDPIRFYKTLGGGLKRLRTYLED